MADAESLRQSEWAAPDDGSETERATLRMPKLTLNAIQAAVEAGRYRNRSEAIRDACREKFMEPGRNVREEDVPGSRRRVRPNGQGAGKKERVNLRLPAGMLRAVGATIDRGWYANRSEALRDACREKFIEGRA